MSGVNSVYSYLDVSVVHAIWDEWGLDCQIDHIKVKNIGIVTCNLTYQTEAQVELMGRVGLTMTRQNEVLHKARTVLNA